MFFMRQRAAKGALTPQQAVDQAAAGALVLIDLREAGELARTGKAEGALHIPLMRLSDMADPRHPQFHPGLDGAGRIALYCASGARSRMAAAALRRLGYEDVHNIGGLSHWIRAGGRVVAG